MGETARTLGEVGNDLVNRPGVLPGKAHGWFRTWFRKVWRVRGGGLYALGYALTFVYLEIRALLGDIVEAESVMAFFTSELIEFLFRFLSESLMNLVLALLWPVNVLQYAPPLGAIGLGVAFLVFPRLLKPPIERWLFGTRAAQEPAVDTEPQ